MKKRLLSTGLAMSLMATALCGVNVQAEESQKFDEPVKLTYMTWDYADRTASTDAWIKGCKEKFNIEIELQNIPTDNYSSMFATKFVADDLGDLVKVHSISPSGKVSDGGVLIDENTFEDLSGLENVSKFSTSSVENVKRFDKVLYVPVSQNALGVLYNKTVFEENGLEIPTNIDEFMNVMDTLKENGIAPLAGSFAEGWSTQIIPFIAWDNYVGGNDPEAGYKLYNGTTGESTQKFVDTVGAEETFALTKEWVDEGYFTDDPLSTDVTVAGQLLANGSAAMFITGNWVSTIVEQVCDDGTEIGFFPLPLNEEGEELYIPTSCNEGICVNAKSENAEAAKIALDYYLSLEIQQMVIDDLQGIATHQDVVMGDFANEVRDAVANNQVLTATLYTRTLGDVIPPDASIYTGLVQEFQNILIGETTPIGLCEKIDASIAEVLEAE